MLYLIHAFKATRVLFSLRPLERLDGTESHLSHTRGQRPMAVEAWPGAASSPAAPGSRVPTLPDLFGLRPLARCAGVCPEKLKLFIDLTFFEFLFMLDQQSPPSADT